MTEQLQLVQIPAVRTLTDRQQHLADAIHAAGWTGVTSDELGAHDHARLRKHDADDRCVYCAPDGRRLGTELRDKKLVKQSRRKREAGDPYTVWISTDQRKPADADQPVHRDHAPAFNRDGIPF